MIITPSLLGQWGRAVESFGNLLSIYFYTLSFFSYIHSRITRQSYSVEQVISSPIKYFRSKKTFPQHQILQPTFHRTCSHSNSTGKNKHDQNSENLDFLIERKQGYPKPRSPGIEMRNEQKEESSGNHPSRMGNASIQFQNAKRARRNATQSK